MHSLIFYYSCDVWNDIIRKLCGVVRDGSRNVCKNEWMLNIWNLAMVVEWKSIGFPD